jgi:outer membrane protein assembly factor BamB
MRLWLVSVFVSASVASAADVWPQFRGPTGQGEALEERLPLEWSESEGIKWKTPLPGRGWSSPVIAGGRIWLTAAEEHEADEAQRAEILSAVEKVPVRDQMVAFASVELKAIEVDLASGKVVRQVKLFEPQAPPPIHQLNTYASPTPVLAEGRLFCHFGTFGTACVDTKSGDVVWRRELALQHIVGPGSSPVLYEKLLIITACRIVGHEPLGARDDRLRSPVYLNE